MAISQKVKQIVWVRDGGCCAICRERLLIEDKNGLSSQFLGEVAHIVAERHEGPRGDSLLTLQQRNHESNLLLLCCNHHTEIDTSVEKFSVESLLVIQKEHSLWLAKRLKIENPWNTKLHNFYYLNVPRLLVLAVHEGLIINLSKYSKIIALHELGWNLNYLMMEFEQLLKKIEVKAITPEKVLEFGPQSRGAIVAFDQNFRTKNIEMPHSIEAYSQAIRGNIKTDPQIYTTLGGLKTTLIIDPRWVTTTTAFVQFHPSGGRGNFAGFGIVNHIDDTRISITPLVIGLPSNSFMEDFMTKINS
ncbi:HNH endonuclease [Pectobacterium aquaticum]|nr:HNH endonuclease signature motif containing protein [Pectobacterium aquaticum]MBN3065148.1 HNH endonuclease [Pectobacterium aquaticum]